LSAYDLSSLSLVKISKVLSFDGSYYQAHTLTNSEQILNKSKKNSPFQLPQAKYSLKKRCPAEDQQDQRVRHYVAK